MKNILITHSYFLRFDKKQWKQQQPYPPLGTLVACSVLREEGFNIHFKDVMFSRSPLEIDLHLDNFSPDIFIIYDDGFNYLTKMCLSNMRAAAFEMIHLAKKKNCTVIVCSSDSTDSFDLYLSEGADFIVQGEGEFTLKELLRSIENGDVKFNHIAGLIYQENDKTIQNPKRLVARDLDLLPFAAWDLLDISQYREAWMKSKGYFSLNMYTTRGCPFHCNWCAKPIYGNRYNARSPKKVVEELIELKSIFSYDHIWFCDDIFGLKPGWVNEFTEEIKKNNLDIRFKIQSRVDLLLTENNVIALAVAGCDEVWVGAESGSQKILDAMDKGTKVEQISEASILLKNHNIKPCFFIQFGYPGEDASDINLTIEMVLKLMPHDIGVSISYPLPGTKFYESVKNELKTKSNWTDSDELLLMFKNTYSSDFYKQLQRYLHRRFRSLQSLQLFYKILKSEEKINYNSAKKYCPTAFILLRLKLLIKGFIKRNLPFKIRMNDSISEAAVAFSNQSNGFDAFDLSNPLLIKLREQVRSHVSGFLKEGQFILELNAGTGLDAIYFAKHFKSKIHAIDIAEGMLKQLDKKINSLGFENKISYQNLSFSDLSKIHYRNFDYAFSNFGGLNCTPDLAKVLSQFPSLLKPGAIITLVIMPPICPWEFLWILKGDHKKAFRRLNKNGSDAKINDDHFKTWYYSYSNLKKILGKHFVPLKVESMSLFFPPPQSIAFEKRNPKLVLQLEKIDKLFRHIYPFKKWGDHYIASFQFKP